MAQLSNQGLAREVEERDLCTSSGACSIAVSGVSTPMRDAVKPASYLSREQQTREAVLLCFSGPLPAQIEPLLQLAPREWKKLLLWLGVSGLALYFLDRLVHSGLSEALPKSVVEDLQQKTKDNAQRTRGMVDESVAIQLEFQEASLCYAVMKGISLSPSSVPRPELRHQFDLDYLMAEKDALKARLILERRGYRLYAIKGKEWGFRINETPNVSVKDLYKDLPYRSVELHLDTDASDQSSRLSRVQYRNMFGIRMPVLSPVDIFLGQALHAFKDLSNGFCRTAHLLEFYRHVLARYNDDEFWREIRDRAESDPKTCLKIGMVTYLITSSMGNFAPEALTSWTIDTLPFPACLWVDLYGRRVVFEKPPGSKLYLLLQKELEAAGVSASRPATKSLLPSRLPPAVIRAAEDETLSTTIARYRVQVRFLFSRLRFHLVEGLRYTAETYRWRRHRDRLSS